MVHACNMTIVQEMLLYMQEPTKLEAGSSTGVVFSACAEVRRDVRRGSFLDRGRVSDVRRGSFLDRGRAFSVRRGAQRHAQRQFPRQGAAEAYNIDYRFLGFPLYFLDTRLRVKHTLRVGGCYRISVD